jgi:L-aspartate oxidase
MSLNVGIERDDGGLRAALQNISAVERAGGSTTSLLNIIATAKLIAAAALRRKESRGAHFRADYPQTDETPLRSMLSLSDAERIVREIDAQAIAQVDTNG